MSYILEALRKADAERERDRGSVPDLHAQLLPPGVADAEVGPARSSLLPWLGLGVLLAAAAGAAWLAWGRVESIPVAPPPPAPAQARVESAAPPASSPVASAIPPPSLPPSVPMAQPQPAASPPSPAPKAVAKSRPPAAASAAAAPPLARTTRESSVAPRVVPAPKVEAPTPPARVPPLAELPAELRQQVPALTIGGSVYSPQASARMVVINGQVFQEGSSLAPELKLEQIRPKAAVLSIRGQRFEVPL